MARELLVYVGTYTEVIRFGTGETFEGRGKGIHIYRMDPSSGTMEPHALAEDVENPSYLAFHPTQRFLYAVNELKTFAGKPGGSLSAFSVDSESGELELLNRQPTGGADPCYVTIDGSGRNALVANYTSGSVCVFPILEDGSLAEASDLVQHRGSGTDPERQAGPHAHSVVLDRSNRYAFICDLGLDKLMIYRFDPVRGTLEPHKQPWVQLKPGAGPRHLALHPDGERVYLINELDSTLAALRYNRGTGSMHCVRTVPALPSDFRAASTGADVHISPSGRYLYGSNRGHDSIVIYRIGAVAGSKDELSYIGHVSTLGKTPRNFCIDPSGSFLLAANQDSDTIAAFHIGPRSGKLTPTDQVIDAPTPVCIKTLLR